MLALRRLAILFGGLVFALMLVGSYHIGKEKREPAPPPKVVQVPKYIQPEDRIIEKKVFPTVCLDAAEQARRVQVAVDDYEDKVGKLPRLVDAAGVAIHGESQQDLNKVREDQSKLQSDSIKSLLALRDAEQRLTGLQVKCTAALR